MKQKFKKIFLFLFGVVFLPVLILVLNLYLVGPLWSGEFSKNTGSIEIVYVEAAKFIKDFWPNLSWNPLWYNGFPLKVLYNPILPFLEVVVKLVFDLPWGRVYRIISGFSYALSPVGVYYLVRYLTKRNFGGFVAALSFSLLPSLVYLFSGPAGYGNSFSWAPWQFLILSVFGEVPHTLALPLVPISGLFFLRALRDFKYSKVLIAVIFLSLMALTNMIAFLAALLLLGAIAFSESSLLGVKLTGVIKKTLLILLIVVGLVSFWFNLSFIKASFNFGEGGGVIGSYLRFILIVPVVVGSILALFYFVFHTRYKLQPYSLSFLWFLPLFFFAFSWYQWELAFAPQPIRYMTEMNMAAVILGSLAVTSLYEWLLKKKFLKFLGYLLWLIVPAFIVYASLPFIKNSYQYLAAQENIEESYEYKISKKIESRVAEDRVFVTGNNAFFLNLFTGVPQLRGGLDQAAVNDWWAHINYQLLKGSDPEVASYLVKAANLNYVLVNLGNSPNFYHDFDYPEKFQYWTKIFEERGDVLYQSPLVHPSLFQVVDGNVFEKLVRPYNAVDKENLETYAKWVDDLARPTPVLVTWVNNGKIIIKTSLAENEALSGQITHDRGWKAYQNGKKLAVKKDVMSNLVIFPKKFGEQEIILEYKTTFDVYLGWGITFLTIFLIIIYPFWGRPKVIEWQKIEAEEKMREQESIKRELAKYNSYFSKKDNEAMKDIKRNEKK